jgi:hypothetical protein
MHIVISRFSRLALSGGLTDAELKAKFEASAPIYRDLQGLVAKYYLMGDEQNDAGGIYVFKTKSDAEAWFTDERIAWATERFGSITFEHYDVPISITTAPPEITDHKT